MHNGEAEELLSSLIPLSLRPLSQHILSYLSCACLGQLVDYLDLFWYHETTHTRMISAPSFECFLGHILATFDRDESFRAFTPFLVSYRSHTTFQNIWVSDNDTFKCYGRYVFTTCRIVSNHKIVGAGAYQKL